MLILDEATSSIDTRTEVKIQEAFARLMQAAQVLLLRTACPQYGKPTLFS